LDDACVLCVFEQNTTLPSPKGTSGRSEDSRFKILFDFFRQYSSPLDASEADPEDIAELIRPLGTFCYCQSLTSPGLHNKRAVYIQQMSAAFLEYVPLLSRPYCCSPWQYPIEFKGIGKYVNDSYKIFCCGEWETTEPNDHMLNRYHRWITKKEKKERKAEKKAEEPKTEEMKKVYVEDELAWCALKGGLGVSGFTSTNFLMRCRKCAKRKKNGGRSCWKRGINLLRSLVGTKY
jgi:hypothetical protein